jgi:phosphoglycolate phosphatase
VDARAVLFDLDGVLVDSRVPFARGVNGALIAQGLPPRPEQELYRYLGPPLHETFAALVPEPSLIEPCVERYRARYRARAALETTVFAGIPELLQRLSVHLAMAVATSKPHALAEPLLEALGMRSFFLAVIGPDLASENEPKAVTVERAIGALPPGSVPVMVGDRSYDVAAAHEHGLRAIGVLWGIGSTAELTTAGADALARNPSELAELLLAGDGQADRGRRTLNR